MERKLKPKAADTRTVDIDDAYTLDFWAKEFGVSKAKLRAGGKCGRYQCAGCETRIKEVSIWGLKEYVKKRDFKKNLRTKSRREQG